MKARRGFTLIEMLVVIGIIATLIGVSVSALGGASEKAQTAVCQELVHDCATALTKVLEDDGAWPNRIVAGASTGKLAGEAACELARRKALSLTVKETPQPNDEKKVELVGLDKFGVVSPWAKEVIKRLASSESLSETTGVPSGGKIDDHILRFAIDADYNGLVEVGSEGGNVTIRASAAVWCCGRDGKFGTKDDVKSWASGQVKGKAGAK